MNTPALLENRFLNLDRQDVAAVVDALGQGALAGTAGVVREYEEHLERYFDVSHAIAVSSGTAALHALLLAYEVGPGDEVILPAIAPVMTALPILAVGATPVFVDIDAMHFGLNLESVMNALTTRTRLVITVPMWGYPTNSPELEISLRDRAIPLIEDSSHAHGMREADGRLSGTIGAASFFSTQERKLIATGEGGFILTDNDVIATAIREIRDFGKIHPSNRRHAHLTGQYGHGFGLNFRISALGAALGITQLAKLEKKIQDRQSNAQRLSAFITDSPLPYLPQHTTGGRENNYSLVLRPNHAMDNAAIGARLAEHGVVSDIYRFGGMPLNAMPYFAPYKTAETPNTVAALKTFVTLPVHEGLTGEDLDRIERALISVEAGA